MKIFLGTPITGIINNNLANPLEDARKSRVSKMISDLRSNGHSVFCALEVEEFGKKVADSFECTVRDYSLLKQSDVYITFPNESYGCAVELGWASAHSIPIILGINKKFGVKTPLYEGLHTVGSEVHLFHYESDNEFPNEKEWLNILKQIEDFICEG
ncbi:hypothetical protein [Ligilactobacillus ruminis]|uniref:hypothetical protein n=1 Tax=Ligilactobacillus ruminis TaxID=1623 RepID=UPI0005570F4F|nr:hypothetical protein [Ligilactobacillus ruminis]